jgi:hypothetical protein
MKDAAPSPGGLGQSGYGGARERPVAAKRTRFSVRRRPSRCGPMHGSQPKFFPRPLLRPLENEKSAPKFFSSRCPDGALVRASEVVRRACSNTMLLTRRMWL